MIALGRNAWPRIVPFAAFVALLAIGGLASGADPRAVHAFALVVAAVLLWAWRREYGELARQNWPARDEIVLAAGVGFVVGLGWIVLDAPWMIIGPAQASPEGGAPLGALQGLIRLLGVVLVVPVMEELFWRSFLLRWMDRSQFEAVDPQRVSLRAVVLATFVFMLAHRMWLAAVAAGLAHTWLYMRTGRLWVPVIAHAVGNATVAAWALAAGRATAG